MGKYSYAYIFSRMLFGIFPIVYGELSAALLQNQWYKILMKSISGIHAPELLLYIYGFQSPGR